MPVMTGKDGNMKYYICKVSLRLICFLAAANLASFAASGSFHVIFSSVGLQTAAGDFDSKYIILSKFSRCLSFFNRASRCSKTESEHTQKVGSNYHKYCRLKLNQEEGL